MAERTIGLRIELNGFKGVVTNIKELEEELKKAKQDLNELEIGGDLFNELTLQISKAEGQLMNLRKASEGIGIEKQLEGYGKFAAGVTSSFAAAQAAVALFGVESEEVSKAAAQAQNILTLALSARGLEELALGTKIVARTIAEKAATAATNTSNKALKALYVTISSNPIGALVAAIGLLVTAVIAFNDTQEESVDVMKAVKNATSEEAEKLKIYSRVLTSANSTNEQRRQVISELKKMYPGFNAFLTEENRLNKEGILFIETKTQALIKQAQADQLVKQIAENNNKLLEIQNRTTEESIGFWDKAAGVTARLFSAYGQVGQAYVEVTAAAKNNAEETKKLQEQNQKLQNSLNGVLSEQDALNQTLTPLTDKLNKQAESEKNLGKETTDASKATEAQVMSQKSLESQLEKTNKQFEDYLEYIETIAEIDDITLPTAKIVEDLQALLDVQKRLIEDPLVAVFRELGVELKIVNNQIEIESDKLGKFSDKFLDFYLGKKDQLLDIVKLPTDQFTKEINKITDEASGLIKTQEELAAGAEGITKEAYDAFIEISNQYVALNKLIREDKPPYEEIFDVNLLNEFITKTNQLAVANGEVNKEFEKTVYSVEEAADGYRNLYIEDEKSRRIIVTSRSKLIEEQKKLLDEIRVEVTKYYTDLAKADDAQFLQQLKNAKLTKEQEKELIEARVKGAVELDATIKKIVETQLEGIKNISTQIKIQEGEIQKVNQQAIELFNQATATSAEARKEALLNNLQAVYDFTQKENGIVINEKQKQAQQIESLTKQLQSKLAKLGIDFTTLTEEEKLQILEFYLNKQVEATKNAEEQKRKEQKITLEDLQQAFQITSQLLTDIASVAAQNFQLQLDVLRYEYEKDMSGIVGDTKEANDKRIELEQIYQAEKKKIEKQAQLTALRFTLAQAIAQGAQAVINALASLPPPANAIVAGLQAVITAAQVSVIQRQISAVQTYMRRGGVVKMSAGGVAQGPSHENGGIYAGGGVYLEGNEAIINRQSTLQYAGLLSQINQQGGGKPIFVGSPMDSRLVEAIAKQRTEPIRAYVMEQDITRAQGINKRLEQLASF